MTSTPAITHGRLTLRPLEAADGPAAWSFLSSHGLQNVYVASQVWSGALETSGQTAAEFFGIFAGAEIRAILYLGNGGLAVPAGDDVAALQMLGDFLAGRALELRALIGPDEAVKVLVPHVESAGAAVRVDVREHFLELGPDELAEDAREPALRMARLDEVDAVARASSRAHLEEMGDDPIVTSPTAFVGRVARQVLDGRVYVIERGRRILFKTEVSAQCPIGAQISGVYTDPEVRGRGLARRATGELAHRLLRESPRVCLFVRVDNAPARRAYDRVGFRRTSDFRTLFFRPASRRV